MVPKVSFGRTAAIAGAFISVAILALSGTIATTTPTLIQISTDPFTTPGFYHQVELETSIATSGSTIVSVFQQARSSTPGGGAEETGFSTTKDAGATWTTGSLPGVTTWAPTLPTTGFEFAANPAVAFDAKHGVFLAISNSLNASSAGVDLVLNTSTDGVTWSPPISVAVAVPGQSWDKEWITCDNTATSPHEGNCYVQWDDNSAHQTIYMSTSSDGGLHWSPATQPVDKASGFAGIPVVQPNGTVVVPYENALQTEMLSFTSTDGGATWGASTVIDGALVAHAPGGGLRMYWLPSAAVDNTGKIYVVWQDCRFEVGCTANDLVLTTSTDGTTWTPVVPIDTAGSGVDYFLPGLAVDPTTGGAGAHLGISFYYYPSAFCDNPSPPAPTPSPTAVSFPNPTPSTCALDVGFISSANGGESWTATTQLAGPMSLNNLSPSDLGPMVGDYNSSVIMGGNDYPAFAVGNPPTGANPYNEAIFSVTGGLPIGVGGGTPIATATTSTPSATAPPGSTPTSTAVGGTPVPTPTGGFKLYLPVTANGSVLSSTSAQNASSQRPSVSSGPAKRVPLPVR